MYAAHVFGMVVVQFVQGDLVVVHFYSRKVLVVLQVRFLYVDRELFRPASAKELCFVYHSGEKLPGCDVVGLGIRGVHSGAEDVVDGAGDVGFHFAHVLFGGLFEVEL